MIAKGEDEAILQPCDQGIIALAKRAYKKMMCNAILEEIESLMDANDEVIAKKLTCFKLSSLGEMHGIRSLKGPFRMCDCLKYSSKCTEYQVYKIKLTKTIDTISDF